jgi:hypothetical protein
LRLAEILALEAHNERFRKSFLQRALKVSSGLLLLALAAMHVVT